MENNGVIVEVKKVMAMDDMPIRLALSVDIDIEDDELDGAIDMVEDGITIEWSMAIVVLDVELAMLMDAMFEIVRTEWLEFRVSERNRLSQDIHCLEIGIGLAVVAFLDRAKGLTDMVGGKRCGIEQV